MTDDDLARRFETERPRLVAMATRMLGSPAEADDAVQEAWLRLARGGDEVGNLGAWLTTVVSRVCIDALRARAARAGGRAASALSLDADALAEPAADPEGEADPEHEALLGDAVGLAMLVVLDQLSPAERVAFVLHDLFGVPFDEIAPALGRNAAAARQLASRARRRVRRTGGDAGGAPDRVRHARVVDAFLAAARGGDFEGLLALLDPDVVLRGDAEVVALGAPPEIAGAAGVGRFCRRARDARPGLLDGAPVAVWVPDGEVRVAYAFTVAQERITAIDLIGSRERLAAVELLPPDTGSAPADGGR